MLEPVQMTRRGFVGGGAALFGGSIAGVFDRLRRPKLSAKTVEKFFTMK